MEEDGFMKHPRVLIVDDREIVRQTLRNILLGFDCVFSEAEYGAAALDLIRENEFDVIFLDLKLPDHSGIEVLRHARDLGKALGKVIVLTGFPEQTTLAEATRLGVFKYLTKTPVDWTEIRAAFAEAISDPAPPPTTPKPKAKLARVPGRLGRRADSAEGTAARRHVRPRLLVLDDDPRWLETMKRELGDEFDLILTTNPDEACKRVTKQRFALVVLDMRLADGVSGLEVLSRMQKAVPTLRAIILTEYPDYPSAVKSGRRGALEYVPKRKLATLADTIKKIFNDRPIRVFLSYDGRDSAKVSRLFDKLKGQGFLPWMDSKSIVPGRKWEPEIRKAIDQSDYFVFCLSRHSMYKEGVLRKELNQALERQQGLLEGSIFFITARLVDCEVVDPFSKFQHVDLFKRDGFANLLWAFSSDQKDRE
jgi:ActR/RegA family two-component response regulator